MHPYLDIARGLTGRIAAAVVAIVIVTGCEVRIAASPAEAGYLSDLINTPVCVEDFDDGLDCGTFAWAEGRLYRPIR